MEVDCIQNQALDEHMRLECKSSGRRLMRQRIYAFPTIEMVISKHRHVSTSLIERTTLR